MKKEILYLSLFLSAIRQLYPNFAKISLILEAGMVKKLLSAIPIATFNKHKWFLLNGTTGVVLIK
ncbi:MAG: hypothetical protein ACK4Z9_06495, partial [Thermodesulfovibrionales bacterium]